MKKIWYFVASILIIIILVVIAMICGFRITYDPNLENSWDAISACAAWIVGILSAVMSAISNNCCN